MKRIVSAILLSAMLITCLLTLSSCNKVETSSPITVFYNIDGKPVQVFMFNNCFDIETEGEKYYVDLKLENGNTMREEIDVTADIFTCTVSVSLLEAIKGFKNDYSPAIQLTPAEDNENAYNGERIANIYYSKQFSELVPVLVATDETGSSYIEAATFNDGEQKFIYAKSNSEYVVFPADPEKIDEINAALPDYSMSKSYTGEFVIEYDEEGNPIKVKSNNTPGMVIQGGNGQISGSVVTNTSYDVTTDEQGNYYAQIVTDKEEPLIIMLKKQTVSDTETYVLQGIPDIFINPISGGNLVFIGTSN